MIVTALLRIRAQTPGRSQKRRNRTLARACGRARTARDTCPPGAFWRARFNSGRVGAPRTPHARRATGGAVSGGGRIWRMDADRRFQFPVALLAMVLLLVLGLGYTTAYLGLSRASISGPKAAVKYRVYRSRWLAFAFWPATRIETVVISRPVEIAWELE